MRSHRDYLFTRDDLDNQLRSKHAQTAGQAAEAYVMHRSMLEYAAYALHINRNPELAQVWLAGIRTMPA